MKIQTLLFSTLSCCLLAACSTTSLSVPTPSQAKVLQQNTNIDAFPSTNGNVAKLIKQDHQSCVIEFTGYLGGGQVTEHWTFNAKGLLSATSSTLPYQTSAHLATQASTIFDIQNPDIQANFKKLQSNFSASNLAQCNSTK